MDRRQQRDLVDRLKAKGFTVVDVGSRRHVRRAGELVVVLPGSCRTEQRAWRNALAVLRARTGVDCRPGVGKRKAARL